MKKRMRFSYFMVIMTLICSMAFSSVSALGGEPADVQPAEQYEEILADEMDAFDAEEADAEEIFGADSAETVIDTSGKYDTSNFVFGSAEANKQIESAQVMLSDDSDELSTKEASDEMEPIALDSLPSKSRILQPAAAAAASNNNPNTAEYLSASMLNKKTTITVDGQALWYYFDVNAANTKVSAHLYSLPNNSDYDIYLWRLDVSTMTLNIVDYSELAYWQTGGEENLGIVVQPGTYYFAINPYEHNGDAQGSYSIYLSTANRDAFEANDSPYEATSVVNSFDERINSDSIADEDWFQVQITQNFAGNVMTLTNLQINNYSLTIYNSNLQQLWTRTTSKSQNMSSTVLPVLQFSPGVYYFKLKPVDYNSSSSASNFRFRIYAADTLVTNYKNDDFVQQGTTIQSYTITGPATNGTYTGKITYTQERASMVTGEYYYASMRNQTKTGTKAQVEDWYAVMYEACGYQRFGSNPTIKVVEDWPN